jgi:hypothetical protein
MLLNTLRYNTGNSWFRGGIVRRHTTRKADRSNVP